MTLRVVPLDRHLLARLVESERDPLTAEMASGDLFADRAMEAASRGHAFALIDGAEVPLGGGLFPLWTGHAEGWWLVSHSVRKRHLAFACRWVARWLQLRQRDPALRRVQMFVRDGEAWSESFAGHIGMKLEGFHRAWDAKGRDHRCFARVVM